jgi:hypothetical protein
MDDEEGGDVGLDLADLEEILHLDLPAAELFLMSFWEASAMHLAKDAVLLADAVARRVSSAGRCTPGSSVTGEHSALQNPASGLS